MLFIIQWKLSPRTLHAENNYQRSLLKLLIWGAMQESKVDISIMSVVQNHCNLLYTSQSNFHEGIDCNVVLGKLRRLVFMLRFR